MLESCHAHEVGVYNAMTVDLRSAMISRQQQFRTIKQIECLLGLISDAVQSNTTISEDALGECGEDVNVDHLTLEFPVPSAVAGCAAAQSGDPSCPELLGVVQFTNGSPTVHRAWTVIAEDDSGSCGDDSIRVLDFPNACSGGAPYRVRIETQDGSEFVEFTTDTCLFGADFADMNVEIRDVTASHGSINDNAQFCKACRAGGERWGDTCWGVVADGHRGCGCNSGGWTGTGMYYGGFSQATRCGSWPGSFSGFRGNGQQKGRICNNGVRILMEVEVGETPKSCWEHLQRNPSAEDGIYEIRLADSSMTNVYCDMANGGWTLVHNVPGNVQQAQYVTEAAAGTPGTGSTTEFYKFSDADVNFISGDDHYFKFDCIAVAGLYRADGWTSLRDQGGWELDKDFDGLSDCTANRPGYIFADYLNSGGVTHLAAGSAQCTNPNGCGGPGQCTNPRHVNYGERSGQGGCYNAQRGWGQPAQIWVRGISAGVSRAQSQSVPESTSLYVGCLAAPSGWARPYGNVPLTAAGAQQCRNNCRQGGYAYFGMECPMGNQVHCQCHQDASSGRSSVSEEFCEGNGNPLVHAHGHCVGPYVVDGWRFGDYIVGSVYRV
jgi:hypothetical protein